MADVPEKILFLSEIIRVSNPVSVLIKSVSTSIYDAEFCARADMATNDNNKIKNKFFIITGLFR